MFACGVGVTLAVGVPVAFWGVFVGVGGIGVLVGGNGVGVVTGALSHGIAPIYPPSSPAVHAGELDARR